MFRPFLDEVITLFKLIDCTAFIVSHFIFSRVITTNH